MSFYDGTLIANDIVPNDKPIGTYCVLFPYFFSDSSLILNDITIDDRLYYRIYDPIIYETALIENEISGPLSLYAKLFGNTISYGAAIVGKTEARYVFDGDTAQLFYGVSVESAPTRFYPGSLVNVSTLNASFDSRFITLDGDIINSGVYSASVFSGSRVISITCSKRYGRSILQTQFFVKTTYTRL